MQALLSQYDINDETFYKILHESHGIIAGSAALCALIGGFESGDIDIWIDGSKLESDGKSTSELSSEFNKYFETKGYKECEVKNKYGKYSSYVETETEPTTDSNRFRKLFKCIVTFENKKEQRIQIILTKSTVSTMDVIKSFDLSVSATWFVPSGPSPTNGYADCEGKIYTYDPVNTLNRIMYRLDNDYCRNVHRRIEKYKSYGFRLLTKKIVPDELIASLIDPSFTI
jgi:hypothetical protein